MLRPIVDGRQVHNMNVGEVSEGEDPFIEAAKNRGEKDTDRGEVEDNAWGFRTFKRSVLLLFFS